MTARPKVQRGTLRRTIVGTLAAATVATGLLVPTTAQASASAANTGSSTVARESAAAKPQAGGTRYFGIFPTLGTCAAAGSALVAQRVIHSYMCVPNTIMDQRRLLGYY